MLNGALVQMTLFFFSSRRRHTRSLRDWSSECSSDLKHALSCAALCALAALLAAPAARAADNDPCDSLVPAAIGGPMLPRSSETAVFRWLANANYERSEERRVGMEWRYRGARYEKTVS